MSRDRIYITGKCSRKGTLTGMVLPPGVVLKEDDVVHYSPEKRELFLDLRTTKVVKKYIERRIMRAIERGFRKMQGKTDDYTLPQVYL